MTELCLRCINIFNLFNIFEIYVRSNTRISITLGRFCPKDMCLFISDRLLRSDRDLQFRPMVKFVPISLVIFVTLRFHPMIVYPKTLDVGTITPS